MRLPPSLPLPPPLQTLFWIRRPTDLLQLCQRRYGNAFRLKLMPFGFSLFSDRESIRAIFAAKSDEMHAGEVNRILRVVVGDSSVLLLDGAEHMRHRKLLLPSFHGERMRFYGETMAAITREAIAGWQEDTPFALHTHTQEITLQIILRTVFGADEGAQLHALHEQIKHMLSAAEHRISLPIIIYMSTHPVLETRAPFKWLLKRREGTDRLLYQQIAERRRDPGGAQGLSQRKDVLAMLMQARDEDGEPLTDRELRDELMTALAAGHETTATALAWAFERILSTPGVYAKLREELEAIGGSDAPPERIAALPYLDATIKEVLRLRPVIPVVGRVLKEPTTLGGYELPAGTAVGACIYLAHRNPDVYPEPDAFRPERFLNNPPDPVSWLPFGGGIRRCIGAQFATYEMKIVLGVMLASCDFELAQPTPAKVRRRAITFWPEGGTRVRIKRRVKMPIAA
ncbi:MAG TPA: cytochrome P450 [Polyangiales bacterium]|nr:cytochrome P450 [Polyangiales bacterium]